MKNKLVCCSFDSVKYMGCVWIQWMCNRLSYIHLCRLYSFTVVVLVRMNMNIFTHLKILIIVKFDLHLITFTIKFSFKILRIEINKMNLSNSNLNQSLFRYSFKPSVTVVVCLSLCDHWICGSLQNYIFLSVCLHPLTTIGISFDWVKMKTQEQSILQFCICSICVVRRMIRMCRMMVG